jgi:hypothetical protein
MGWQRALATVAGRTSKGNKQELDRETGRKEREGNQTSGMPGGCGVNYYLLHGKGKRTDENEKRGMEGKKGVTGEPGWDPAWDV